MTNTLIGIDYTGAACIKMTKDEYDPITTPDSEVGAFLYNSKWAADVKYGTRINLLPYSSGYDYFPPGSNYLTYALMQTSGHLYYRDGVISTSLYDAPLFETKAYYNSNGRYFGDAYDYLGIVGYQERGVKWGTNAGREHGWCNGMIGTWTSPYVIGNGLYSQNVNTNVRKSLSIWRLPGDESPILHGEPIAPVSGLDSILLNNDTLKVAKPGYNVHTASTTQLAIDTANMPSKIIAADDIAIPVGTTVYDCGINLPSNVVVDVHYYVGSTVYYPSSPQSYLYGADYYIDGTNIVFVNSRAACRARFWVVAHAAHGVAEGNNYPLRHFNDGDKDVVQFLRPGASGEPTLDDIVLDSRWPCIQILKEGVITLGSSGGSHTVEFDGDGCFPMVKYMTIHGAGSANYAGVQISWSKRIRQPFAAVTYIDKLSSPYPPTPTGDCSYCTLTSNSATFRWFKGNPTQVYFNDLEDFDTNRVRASYDPNPPYAIRYYIFGIAK